MELKQSSAVPFAVTDPISGLDITKDVQLVSIESVGEGDFPYFQPNGDYTFTVVNAARDEIVTPTTFTLDVPFDGEVHRLTATTDMTIQATQADFMKVSVLKPLGSVIIAPVNSILNMELQSSYRGIDLTADDVIIQKHKPGTPPDTAYPIKFVSATTKADGRTLDVKWQGADTMIGPFTFYVLRKGTTGLVEGEDWVQIDMNLRIGISGMRIQPLHQASGSIFGHQNELINGWFVVYKDGIPIKLNDPGLTLTLVGSTNVPNVSAVIAIDERFEDHITFKILGKPTAASNNPVSGSFYGQFDIKASYTGSEAVARVDITWVPGTDMMSTATMQQPLFANQTQKLVTQFDEVNGVNIPPWYTIEGAKVRVGSIFVNQFNGGGVIQQVVVEPGTPLNSINQLVKEISASWMKQRVSLSGFVLDLPFITDPTLYQTMWRLNAQTTIEMAPVEITPNTTIVPGTAGSAMSVVLKATQKRGDEVVRVSGSWSAGSVTGAANYLQLMSTAEGDGLFRMTGKGTNGDVVLKGTFTSTADGITQPFEVKLTADASYIFEMNPKAVNVKMWDVLTEPPFSVKIDRVDSPQRITNVQVIKNAYIQGVEGKPNEWEVYRADTSVAAPSTYFTFDLVLDSGTINCVGQGTYNIAAFDGIWLKPNAEYTPGDRVSKVLLVPQGGSISYTFYPVYKGQPAADKVELVPPVADGVVYRGQKLNDQGDGIIVTLSGATNFTTRTAQFTYKVKGIPDNELVNNQTKVSEYVSLTAVPKGLDVKFQSDPQPVLAGLNERLRFPVSRITLDGVVLQPDDKHLRYKIVPYGVDPSYVEQVGVIANDLYLVISTKPPRQAYYTQSIVASYVADDGTITESKVIPFTIGYSPSRDQNGVRITLKGDPLANTENFIPVDIAVDGNDPLAPSSITQLGTAAITVTPLSSNSVIDNVITYEKTGHIRFKSGWTGGSVSYAMLIGSVGSPTPVQPVIFEVPAAPITITPSITEFNGIADTVTTMTFTATQERLIDGSVVSYDFAGAVVQEGSTATGSIKSLTSVVNNGGVFTVVFTSKGVEGSSTLTIPVKDSRGDGYSFSFDLTAVIDSTGYVLTLTPNTASGKKGDRITFTGSLTLDGVNQRMDDVGQTWSVEPAGYMSMGMRNQSDVRFDITRTTGEIENVDVYLVVRDRPGHTAKHKVALEVLPNLEITPKEYNVKVWDRVSGYPFTVKDGATDITSTLLDIKHESPWLTNDTPLNWFDGNASAGKPLVIITPTALHSPEAAHTVVIPWSFRLSSEPVGTKHIVNVTYHIADFNGKPLTASLVPFGSNEPLIIAINGTADIDIVVLDKGKLVTTISNYLSAIKQEYATCINNSRFASQVRLGMRAGTTEGYGGVQEHIIFPGNPVANGVEGDDYAVGRFTVNVWNASAPFKLWSVEPNPVEGKFGDIVEIKANAFYQGRHIDVNSPNITALTLSPSTTLSLVDGSRTKNGFSAEFMDDIQENVKESNVTVSMKHANVVYNSALTLKVKQTALILKLTPASGFQTTGSGDVDNPVTLTQSVLDPE